MYSIVIPAYNEAERLDVAISNYSEKFVGEEIIVVCDGTDNSDTIVEKFSNKNPNIRLMAFDSRQGKGNAIIKGFKSAKGEMIGFADADESVSPEELSCMFKALESADSVIASRRLNTSKILVKQPLLRRFASRMFNLFVRIVFSLPFSDTQCGAKVFRRDAIYDIIDELETKGFETDVEILWRLNNKNYKIIEYPITWKHSVGSKFKLAYSTSMLISLLRIRFK